MVQPRYHANRAKKASINREKPFIESKSRFMPELTVEEFIRGIWDKKTADKILRIRSAEAYKLYCKALSGKHRRIDRRPKPLVQVILQEPSEKASGASRAIRDRIK